MPKIFISYRRDVSIKDARLLYYELIKLYNKPDDSVFFDKESIRPGDIFAEVITKEVNRCDTFLLLLNNGTLNRIHDDNDWLKREVILALSRKEAIRIIPILIDNFLMPEEETFPQEIKHIADTQGASLRDDTFQYDISRLIEEINNRNRGFSPRSPSINSSQYHKILGLFKPTHLKQAIQGLTLFGDAGELSDDNTWEIDLQTAKGHGVYGPYIHLDAGRYKTIFSLKIDKTGSLDRYVATIDVTRNIGNDNITKMRIFAQDFQFADVYQEFTLNFELLERSQNIEFRLGTEKDNPSNRIINLKSVILAKV